MLVHLQAGRGRNLMVRAPWGPVARSAEHPTFNQRAPGSIPGASTNFFNGSIVQSTHHRDSRYVDINKAIAFQAFQHLETRFFVKSLVFSETGKKEYGNLVCFGERDQRVHDDLSKTSTLMVRPHDDAANLRVREVIDDEVPEELGKTRKSLKDVVRMFYPGRIAKILQKLRIFLLPAKPFN